MKSSYIAGFILCLAVVLISASVIAEDANIGESKRNDFNARLDHVRCRIELVKKQINLLSGVDASLNSYKAPLDTDYLKLQELAATLNSKEFSDYFTTTFKDNLMNAVKAIQDDKRNVRSTNLTREEKTSLRDNDKVITSEFAECINKADKNFTESRIKYFGAWINRWNNIISKMKEKGYDTSEMEGIVADTKKDLLLASDQIKNAGRSGKRIVVENAKNVHLHSWARFEIARIRSYLKSIESDSVAKGYQSNVDLIKAKLDEASNIAVVGKKYKEGEFEGVWKLIRDAAQMLKELNKKLR